MNYNSLKATAFASALAAFCFMPNSTNAQVSKNLGATNSNAIPLVLVRHGGPHGRNRGHVRHRGHYRGRGGHRVRSGYRVRGGGIYIRGGHRGYRGYRGGGIRINLGPGYHGGYHHRRGVVWGPWYNHGPRTYYHSRYCMKRCGPRGCRVRCVRR